MRKNLDAEMAINKLRQIQKDLRRLTVELVYAEILINHSKDTELISQLDDLFYTIVDRIGERYLAPEEPHKESEEPGK